MATDPKDMAGQAELDAAIQAAKEEAAIDMNIAPTQAMTEAEYERYLADRAREEEELERLYQEAVEDDPDLAKFLLSEAILRDRGSAGLDPVYP